MFLSDRQARDSLRIMGSYFSQLKELPNYCFKCYHIFEIQNKLSEGPFVFSFMSPS